jgi:hypothetical protein
MPVRRAIQSSSTPRRAPISALVTTVSGTLTATDAARAPTRRGAGQGQARLAGRVADMSHTLWTATPDPAPLWEHPTTGVPQIHTETGAVPRAHPALAGPEEVGALRVTRGVIRGAHPAC